MFRTILNEIGHLPEPLCPIMAIKTFQCAYLERIQIKGFTIVLLLI